MKKSLDSYLGIMDPVIHSHMYLALLEYHKVRTFVPALSPFLSSYVLCPVYSLSVLAQVKGLAADFFRNSLLYLTYTPLASIPEQAQISLANDVSLAALLGHDIYNFGELVSATAFCIVCLL